MKKLLHHLFLLVLLTLSYSCYSQSCENLPTYFSSYMNATNTVKSTSFELQETIYSDSWITKATFYSCDRRKGYLIITTSRGKEYIFKDVGANLWYRFKDAGSKGKFYHTYLKGESKYRLNLN